MKSKTMQRLDLTMIDDDRLAKLILIEQKRSAQPNCWYSEIKTVIETLQIKQDPESTSKQEWKTATKSSKKSNTRKGDSRGKGEDKRHEKTEICEELWTETVYNRNDSSRDN